MADELRKQAREDEINALKRREELPFPENHLGVQDGGIDADEFYEAAMAPNFPDEMYFQIRAANPENKGTFSREGISDTVDLMDAFIMARILGKWRETGLPPKEMKMKVSIEWVYDPEIAQGLLPYFDADIGEGQTQIDSERRIPRTKRK